MDPKLDALLVDPELDVLLADLAGSLLRTQDVLNRQFEGDLDEQVVLAATAPEDAKELVKTCLPSLQLARSMTVDVRGKFSKRKSTEFKISFRPLNAIYYVLHQTTVTSQSRIRLTVEQSAVLHPKKKEG